MWLSWFRTGLWILVLSVSSRYTILLYLRTLGLLPLMSQWHASPAQTIYSVMALHAREVSYLFRSSTAKSLKLFFNNLSGPNKPILLFTISSLYIRPATRAPDTPAADLGNCRMKLDTECCILSKLSKNEKKIWISNMQQNKFGLLIKSKLKELRGHKVLPVM